MTHHEDKCWGEVTWQIKNVIYPLSQYLWSQKFLGWSETTRYSHPYIWMLSQQGGHVRSRGKLNTLYIHLQKIHGHQTRQGADLHREASILRTTPRDALIKWLTWGVVTIWKNYISTIIKLMSSKHYMVLTYGRRFSMKTLKPSPTSCIFLILLSICVFCWYGLAYWLYFYHYITRLLRR